MSTNRGFKVYLSVYTQQSTKFNCPFFLENHQIVLKEKSPKCYAHQIKIISQYMYECRLHMADLVFKAKLRRPV